MGILDKLLGLQGGVHGKQGDAGSREQGALVHVFIFDTGPMPEDAAKYRNSIVRSLLPESMAYVDLAVTFHTDAAMPAVIGHGGPGDLGHATDYPYAWMNIGLEHREYIDGLKAGRERYTFRAEEYESERGNRGILYAFYELARPAERS